MFNPLPAIALLPLALLWFGIGEKSSIFVLVHAVLWPLALNTYFFFRGVSETLRLTGQSFGLGGLRFAWKIFGPAAFPAILTGLKIAWAFAWRTLIVAELVFGVSFRERLALGFSLMMAVLVVATSAATYLVVRSSLGRHGPPSRPSGRPCCRQRAAAQGRARPPRRPR